MQTFIGKSVCGGIAFGKVYTFKKAENTVKRRHISDVHSEIERYIHARDRAIYELDELFHKASREIGDAEAQIFSIHGMMLEDADYNESVINLITNRRLDAETAVLMTSDKLSGMFGSMEDSYMKARAADVKDVSDRILRVLAGGGSEYAAPQNSVIFAEDLSPSETLQMDKSKISAFVTEKGSATSHTAILARSMNIPAVTGISLADAKSGSDCAVDGYTGVVYVDPDENILQSLRAKKLEKDRLRELLKELKDKPTVTRDGKTVKLYANIGTPADLGSVILSDAEGIGLFRSEFLYLESSDYPSEDVQFEAYKKVAEGMGDKPVIIRTLDIGADKQIDYFNLEKEENPALGMRAIRICLSRRDIFKTQLRAILRASAFGSIMIMLPMIVSCDEVEQAKIVLAEAKSELAAEGLPFFENIPLGIMIETPAAAVISDKLAEIADFFSVGTNDLTQYMLAMDRQNHRLSIDTHHEAILRTIETVIKNSHKCGIWTGICGELGSDTTIIPRLLKMGIDEFSVSPGKILEVRKIIRESYAK